MVRPCVARGLLRVGRFAVLHQCIRPLIGAFCAPGHHGYQHACELILCKALRGEMGHHITDAPDETVSPSSQSDLHISRPMHRNKDILSPRPSDAGAAQVLFLVRCPRMRVGQFAGSVLSEMCQIAKRLLKLASRRGKSNSHRVGSSLQTMAVGYGYRYLRLTIGQLESRS